MEEKTYIDPDVKYQRIVESGNEEEAIEFFKEELSAILDFKELLAKCVSKKMFNDNLKEIIELSNKLRVCKLDFIQDQLKFYQFDQKKYLKLLRTNIIKR